MAAPLFDVAIVGGGIAGSTLGGVLARAGLGVLVVEREAQFRDRVRGEASWPWGMSDVRALALEGLLAHAGPVVLRATKTYAAGQPVETLWQCTTPRAIRGVGFSDPRLQQGVFCRAGSHGA